MTGFRAAVLRAGAAFAALARGAAVFAFGAAARGAAFVDVFAISISLLNQPGTGPAPPFRLPETLRQPKLCYVAAEMDQLALSLESGTRAEAGRRGLDVDASIEARDQRMVGVIGGALAHLNRSLEEAAARGYEMIVSVHYSDTADGVKVAVVRGRIRRLSVDARV